MPSCNLFLFSFILCLGARKSRSSPNPVASGDGGAHLATQVFGVNGFADPRTNLFDALTRVDGQVGKAHFDENLDNIVDFVDKVLELLVSLHEKGIAHGHASRNPQFTRVSLLTCVEHRNLIEEYVMSKISTPTHPATRPRVEYYFVGFREGQEPLRPINANLGYIFDVGCVGVIFERMFCTEYPTSFLYPLVKAMKDSKLTRRPSAKEAQSLWLKIKTERLREMSIASGHASLGC